jgi:hypothetical protein
MHVVGTPMLNDSLLAVTPSCMQSLHDAILTIETRRIREKDQSFLVFPVKVPVGLGFVDSAPADMFYLRFTDIFDMFQTHQLHHTLVRLFSLSTAMQIIREEIPGIAVVDPYFMHHCCM